MPNAEWSLLTNIWNFELCGKLYQDNSFLKSRLKGIEAQGAVQYEKI